MEGGPLLEDWWVKLASTDFIPYLNIGSQLPDTPDVFPEALPEAPGSTTVEP